MTCINVRSVGPASILFLITSIVGHHLHQRPVHFFLPPLGLQQATLDSEPSMTLSTLSAGLTRSSQLATSSMTSETCLTTWLTSWMPCWTDRPHPPASTWTPEHHCSGPTIATADPVTSCLSRQHPDITSCQSAGLPPGLLVSSVQTFHVELLWYLNQNLFWSREQLIGSAPQRPLANLLSATFQWTDIKSILKHVFTDFPYPVNAVRSFCTGCPLEGDTAVVQTKVYRYCLLFVRACN